MIPIFQHVAQAAAPYLPAALHDYIDYSERAPAEPGGVAPEST
jgi:hypothetical protein